MVGEEVEEVVKGRITSVTTAEGDSGSDTQNRQ
jgi:hypothetical protein